MSRTRAVVVAVLSLTALVVALTGGTDHTNSDSGWGAVQASDSGWGRSSGPADAASGTSRV